MLEQYRLPFRNYSNELLKSLFRKSVLDFIKNCKLEHRSAVFQAFYGKIFSGFLPENKPEFNDYDFLTPDFTYTFLISISSCKGEVHDIITFKRKGDDHTLGTELLIRPLFNVRISDQIKELLYGLVDEFESHAICKSIMRNEFIVITSDESLSVEVLAYW